MMRLNLRRLLRNWPFAGFTRVVTTIVWIPIVPCNVNALKDFKTRFWDFYGDLLKYKQNPSPETAAKLSIEFDELFSTKTIYDALNDRIEKTRNKKERTLVGSEISLVAIA
jgi:hypothetical protein